MFNTFIGSRWIQKKNPFLCTCDFIHISNHCKTIQTENYGISWKQSLNREWIHSNIKSSGNFFINSVIKCSTFPDTILIFQQRWTDLYSLYRFQLQSPLSLAQKTFQYNEAHDSVFFSIFISLSLSIYVFN